MGIWRSLPLAAVLASCSMGTSSPDNEELVAALRAHFSDLAIIDARLVGACQPGRVAEREVQVCGYCVIWVGAAKNQMTGDVRSVVASKGRYQAALTRAISFSQPLVAPTGSGGVWILATAPTADSQSGQATSSVTLSDEQIAATGVSVERDRSNFGFGPERIRASADGQFLSSAGLLARFEPPAASKEVTDPIVAAVGSCET